MEGLEHSVDTAKKVIDGNFRRCYNEDRIRFPMYIGFHRIQRESSLCSMEGLIAYRIYGSIFRISILGKCRISKRKIEKHEINIEVKNLGTAIVEMIVAVFF